jgi:acyloxyacyl hydrolase
MNDNETIRNAATARAIELSNMYPQIIANNTFKNFDMQYYPWPWQQVLQLWLSMGGQGGYLSLSISISSSLPVWFHHTVYLVIELTGIEWQLIEPIDGFHPNQIAGALLAQTLWQSLVADHPEWFGPPNPNNALIKQLFGDQGGY